jgi:hypothetical protein
VFASALQELERLLGPKFSCLRPADSVTAVPARHWDPGAALAVVGGLDWFPPIADTGPAGQGALAAAEAVVTWLELHLHTTIEVAQLSKFHPVTGGKAAVPKRVEGQVDRIRYASGGRELADVIELPLDEKTGLPARFHPSVQLLEVTRQCSLAQSAKQDKAALKAEQLAVGAPAKAKAKAKAKGKGKAQAQTQTQVKAQVKASPKPAYKASYGPGDGLNFSYEDPKLRYYSRRWGEDEHPARWYYALLAQDDSDVDDADEYDSDEVAQFVERHQRAHQDQGRKDRASKGRGAGADSSAGGGCKRGRGGQEEGAAGGSRQ